MTFSFTKDENAGIDYFCVNGKRVAFLSKETNYHWHLVDEIHSHMLRDEDYHEGEYLKLSLVVDDAAKFLSRVASWFEVYQDLLPSEFTE